MNYFFDDKDFLDTFYVDDNYYKRRSNIVNLLLLLGLTGMFFFNRYTNGWLLWAGFFISGLVYFINYAIWLRYYAKFVAQDILLYWTRFKVIITDKDGNDHNIYILRDNELNSMYRQEQDLSNDDLEKQNKELLAKNMFYQETIKGYKRELLDDKQPYVIITADKVAYANKNNQLMLFSTQQSAQAYIDNYLNHSKVFKPKKVEVLYDNE